jgi:hypothetical protein
MASSWEGGTRSQPSTYTDCFVNGRDGVLAASLICASLDLDVSLSWIDQPTGNAAATVIGRGSDGCFKMIRESGS